MVIAYGLGVTVLTVLALKFGLEKAKEKGNEINNQWNREAAIRELNEAAKAEDEIKKQKMTQSQFTSRDKTNDVKTIDMSDYDNKFEECFYKKETAPVQSHNNKNQSQRGIGLN